MAHGKRSQEIALNNSIAAFLFMFIFANCSHASCVDSPTHGEAIKCLEDKIESLSFSAVDHTHSFAEVPKGTVAAFELVNCPTGWESYEEAAGRFVVGVGSNAELSPKALGQVGGREKITLSISQMPKHQHNTPQAMADGGGPHFGLGPIRLSVHGKNWATNTTEMTSIEGGGEGIDITPPFVSLRFCIKR